MDDCLVEPHVGRGYGFRQHAQSATARYHPHTPVGRRTLEREVLGCDCWVALLYVDDCLVEPHVDRGRGLRSERAKRESWLGVGQDALPLTHPLSSLVY